MTMTQTLGASDASDASHTSRALPTSHTRAPKRAHDPESASFAATVIHAEMAYAQAREPSRMLSATCFLLSAALAVWAPERSAPLMIALMVLAIVFSASSRWMALHRYRSAIEAAARATGLSKAAAQERAMRKLEERRLLG